MCRRTPQPLPSARAATPRGSRPGSTERYLFLYLEVDDPHFVAEPADRASRSRPLRSRRPHGREARTARSETYFFATERPRPDPGADAVKGDDGIERAAREPRIQAFWLQTLAGYHLEARMPLSLVGSRLWIEARDGSAARVGFHGRRTRRAADGCSWRRRGSTTCSPPSSVPGTRATVVDANGLKLGTAGAFSPRSAGEEMPTRRAPGTGASSPWTPPRGRCKVVRADRVTGKSVAAALAGHPAAEWLRTGGSQDLVLMAAAPIMVGDAIRGAVVLEQAGDQLLELRDRALTHLFNLTLLATALAVLFAFSVATVISLRIGRLRAAADAAVGNDGSIRLEMPESARADEIGALARGFERLLARLNEHTQYLRTLGGKLSHELRTPLTIVRSSLDNLESEGRARGPARLRHPRPRGCIAPAIDLERARRGGPGRGEHQASRAGQFRFAELLASAVAGYRDAFPASRVRARRAGRCVSSCAVRPI